MRFSLQAPRTLLLAFLLPANALLAQVRQDSIRTLDDVVVSAQRAGQPLMQSPVSIDKENLRFFRRAPGLSFFDALQTFKGVQMITPSLGFRVLNTRGFANTTNVRFAQLVDGMDVQSPHIGAPIANALGPGDLDIRSVEIVAGSAAAMYGMNSTNGMADLITFSPFEKQGLSVQQKIGVNHIGRDGIGPRIFSETSLRWAQAVNKKFAYKASVTFNKGHDWIADDRTDLNPNSNASTGLLGEDNPAADPVNGYGNESPNRRTLSLQGKNYVVARTGYLEQEVADYRLQNLKADASMVYKFSDKASLGYVYRIAHFNTVYQRANRFSLKNYLLQQHGIDYSSRSVKAKVYLNAENTGKSYNLRSLAENMDRLHKTDDRWFADYALAYHVAAAQGALPADAHRRARTSSDDGRLQPGTSAFDQAVEELRSINNWDSGAALRVKAVMAHAELQVDLTEQYLAAFSRKTGITSTAGVDWRSYFVNPDGNYFINPESKDPGKDLVYGRWGAFIMVNKDLLKGKLKASLVMRMDKNRYFSIKPAVRASLVYDPLPEQTLRLAYQSGYRYPSVFEGFSNINSGGVKRVGGFPVMSQGVFEQSWLRTSVDAFTSAVNRDVNTQGLTRSAAIEKNKGLLKTSGYTYLQPESIRSIEAGYRVRFWGGRLFADLDLYLNSYGSFIAQVETSVPHTTVADSIPYALYDRRTQSRYRLWTNSVTSVKSYGASLKARYAFMDRYFVNGTLSYAGVSNRENADGLEDGFNTPQWMFNMGVSGDRIWKDLGASVQFRWQSGFYWQSFLVNGQVPAVAALDAQLSYALPGSKILVRIGATNLTNRYQVSFLGGPRVGGFYYTTITYGL